MIKYEPNSYGNKAKDDDLYQKCAAWWVKSCWKCVTWVRSRNIVIAESAAHLAGEPQNPAFAAHRGGYGESHSCAFRALIPYAGGSGNHEADHRPDGNVTMVSHHRFIVDGG